MDVQYGPNSVDEPNLLYKLQRKIKVFNTNTSFANRGYGLVTSSSKYGTVFVGLPNATLSVYHLRDLINKECEPQHLSVRLPENPTHVSVSCDQELLAVTGGQLLCIYKVIDFQNSTVQPSLSIKCDTNPATFVSALQWNPCIADSIAIAYFDGTLMVCQVSNGQVKKVQSKARCICWSPKGKQLVTGNSDGTLCQFKPDLTAAKLVPAPNLFNGAPVEALAIYWISTYQFAVVFKNACDTSRPAVTIVNTPKAGQPLCLNYEDICYSMGNDRPWYYSLQGITQWNMILSASSNSMEIATLGSADGATWQQWCQTDEARPELPLINKKIENYPMGVSVDTCALHQLPWGENELLPHMPSLLVVSQSGLLTIFNIINLKKEAVQICSPPQMLALPADSMTSDIFDDAPSQPTQPLQQPPPPTVPAPEMPKPQPVQVPQTPAAPQATFPTPINQALVTSTPKAGFQQQGFGVPAASQAQVVQLKQESRTDVAAPQPELPAAQPQTKTQQAQEINAALKAEQERINKVKVDQELRSMLVKEVNDFQTELYKFNVRTREMQNKLQQDLNSINMNFDFQSLDAEKLKKDCGLEELRNAIIQLKFELLRTNAVIAEARTHSDAKDIYQWTQVDPLTAKRVATIKKLSYYVQTQLEQANKAMDFRWNEMMAKDPHFNKPGQRMIRPILEDVYQPLVKQQEILARQQAVLRTLRNTLNECDATPMFKSTSLLRSTPFRNKDPLSKLTKNILNMSLDKQTNTSKVGQLTPYKLDALRDMLCNHRPTKIKSVNVELRHHLELMKLNYEKNVREKSVVPPQATVSAPIVTQAPKVVQSQATLPQHNMAPAPTIVPPQPRPQTQEASPQYSVSQYGLPLTREPVSQTAPVPRTATVPPPPYVAKIAAPAVKPDLISKQPMPISVPSFTPVLNTAKPNTPGLTNVARTLFTDENKQEPAKPQPRQPKPQPQQPQSQSQPQPFSFGKTFTNEQPFGFNPSTSVTASPNTRSVLKDMLQNKQANVQDGQANIQGSQVNVQASPANVEASQARVQGSQANVQASQANVQASQARVQTSQAKVPSSQANVPLSQANLKIKQDSEVKNESNMFMGQKICSPSAFAASTVSPSTTTSTFSFTSKPISDKNILNKFTPQTFSTETKPLTPVIKPKSSETGEPESETKSDETKNATEKPFPNLFGTKSPLAGSNQNIPDIVKGFAIIKPEAKIEKPKENNEKLSPKSSENIPQKSDVKKESPAEPVKTSTSLFGTSITPVVSTPATTLLSTPTSPVVLTSTTSDKIPQPVILESASPTSSPASIFGSPTATATTSVDTSTVAFATTTAQSASSIFGSAVASQPTINKTQSGSIFSTTLPSASVFGASPSSIFGSNTTSQTSPSSSFEAEATPTTESKPSVFSAPSPSSVFGTVVTTQTAFASPTSQSLFGSSPSFGSTTTQSGSIFSTTTTTPQSVFGAGAATSIFAVTTVTTQAALFGNTTTTTQSVFGTPTATTQASIFGSTTQPSAFGTSSAPAFGAAATQSQQTSIFGAATPASSVFGSGQATPSSVFGTSGQNSVFGCQPTTTTQSGSLFGGRESSLFASASISTTSAPTAASGGSIFGSSPSGSVFGSSNTNVFGGKTTFDQSNATAAAIFGGGGAAVKPASDFWSAGNANAGSGFGSSGFGQQATTQSSSIFSGGSSGNFSAATGQQAFGAPQPQASIFGSPQQSASTFGGSSVFGSNPAFGQPTGFSSPTASGGFGGFGGLSKSPSSGFGGPAAFGGAPAFGAPAFGSTSPGKMFGSGAAASATGFGSPTQSNATFESLATQNTLTFGNLAQQSPTPTPPAPTFNSSPSFTGWRG